VGPSIFEVEKGGAIPPLHMFWWLSAQLIQHKDNFAFIYTRKSTLEIYCDCLGELYTQFAYFYITFVHLRICLLHSPCFNLEGGSDLFLRNVSWLSTDSAPLHLSRQNSSIEISIQFSCCSSLLHAVKRAIDIGPTERRASYQSMSSRTCGTALPYGCDSVDTTQPAMYFVFIQTWSAILSFVVHSFRLHIHD
jgi:hypothetical protein